MKNIINKINNGKRTILKKIVKNFIKSKDYFLFITDPRKIGKSLTIFEILNFQYHRLIYFDLSLLNKLDKIKQYNYFIKEFYRLFDIYSKYIVFMKDFCDKMINFDNINILNYFKCC